MKKLYPLLSVLFLIYWGCLDPLNIFDSNDEETVNTETETGPSVNLWGVDYSIENTTVLNLYNQGLTGSIPSEIGNLTNLTELKIRYNQLTGSIPSEIGNLTNLKKLYLSYNDLTGSIPPEIGNLTNLTSLDLESNQLTGIIPDEICNQGDSSPGLSNNKLCPPYPSCIEEYVGNQDISNCEGWVELWGEYYSVENTTELSLGNSGLTGEIPPEIGNLTNLTELRLDNSQLTGSIPSEIGNLTNLTYLNLGRNQLTGDIPESICNLVENNCFINISYNQLCPPYPSCIEDYVYTQDTSDCD